MSQCIFIPIRGVHGVPRKLLYLDEIHKHANPKLHGCMSALPLETMDMISFAHGTIEIQ